MPVGANSNRARLKSVLFGAVALFLATSIVMYPETAFQSSLEGLKIWWEVVFPALLPFLIAAEMMMGFGIVHLLGVLLEPLMRPVFRVPGAGAFVLVMGWASGYPVAAKLTVQLRQANLITRSEGERLVSFCSTADPLFMFGAIAVGFFHEASLGVILAIAHYAGSFLTGIAMRFHEPKGTLTPPFDTSHDFILLRALKAMHRARIKDGRTLGQLMGEAITNALNTLFMVGGFIILFSVIINVLAQINVDVLIGSVIAVPLVLIGIPPELAPSLVSGIFEVTLGSRSASLLKDSLPLVDIITVTSALIAWSGLSIHAQVASILSVTDIRYTPYLISRLLHTVLTGAITALIWNPAQKYLTVSSAVLPAFLQQSPENNLLNMWSWLEFIGMKILLFLLGLVAVALLLHLIQTYYLRKK